MTIEKKLKSASLFLGICLGIYVVFMLYYLFEDGCWNCSPQDYYSKGIAMISESENDNSRLKKGVRYLKTAAKRDNIKAIIFLGELYTGYFPDMYLAENKKKIAILGNIVSVNARKGKSYLNSLIDNQSFLDKKYNKAQYNLGLLYKAGILKSKNKEIAYNKWFTISTENGNPLAMYQIGIHFNDKGEYTEALKWFKKAFDCGQEPGSAIMTGDYYFYGKGVIKNYYLAIEWYQRALNILTSQNISPWIKNRKKLTELVTQRLYIGEKKIHNKIQKEVITIKYSINGDINTFSVFISDQGRSLIGKVKKQNGDILAQLDIINKSIPSAKSAKVASMSEGSHWILNTYAKNKYGADRDFNFVITKVKNEVNG